MALANFFERVTVAGLQAMPELGALAFRDALERVTVGIAFDRAACTSPEGRATLDLSVRLLARLYARLLLLPLGRGARQHANALSELARSINPLIEIVAKATPADAVIVVGDSAPPSGGHVYAGSDGWRVRLSSSRPVGSGSSGNPVGAGAAACLAVANVFRMTFSAQLADGALDDDVDLSMLTYERGGLGGEVEPAVTLGTAHLVGFGAIGNGFVWALERWAGLDGELHVIDAETVDLGNLQRYVLTDQSSVGRVKVELAGERLAGTGLIAHPHATDWQAFVAAGGDWRRELVAVALDTAEDRIAVQGALPRRIVNAWTQAGDLGVSRHGFGEGPCLACMYMPKGKSKDRDQVVAEQLGLPDAQLEVRALLQTGAPVDAELVARVEAALGILAGSLGELVGQPLEAFHQKAICGGAVLRLGGGSAREAATVPMAFQSALAGVMLAAEAVKQASGVATASMASTRIDLMRPLGTRLNDPKGRDPTGRCICADDDFLSAYRAKYSAD